MQQHKIKIIGTELLQRHVNGFEGILIAVIADPYLGGQEQILTVDTGIFDALTDFRFVEVRLCGVDMTISGFDGFTHAARSVLFADLEDAVANLRNLNAIGKFQIFHLIPFHEITICNRRLAGR